MSKYFAAAIILGVVGLASGMVAADYHQNPTYCEQIEKNVTDRGKINGTIACVDPSSTDLNISEEASAELKCSCMIVHEGQIQFINVGTA